MMVKNDVKLFVTREHKKMKLNRQTKKKVIRHWKIKKKY